MNLPVSRHIPLEGALNFRDFGGYPAGNGLRVRWRQLFRSDRLSALTLEDYRVLDSLDIELVCDLRRGSEQERAPTRWQGRSQPELLHLPLLAERGLSTLERARADVSDSDAVESVRQIMLNVYELLVTDDAIFPYYREIFERLARPTQRGVLIHCSGGKDRTGVSCALIQSVLGVERERIFEDFMLSQQYYSDRVDLASRVPQAADYGDANSLELMRPVFNVEPAYLQTAFDIIEHRHDTVEQFLTRGVGIETAVLERIRERLLEPVSS